jgi:CheY-like chemotaxis protein
MRAQTDKEHKTLDTLETSALRGADLVKQILTFARGIEGKRGPIQLKHIIRDVEKIATETFPKSIRISMDIQKDLLPVHGDNTQLHQVLMNLCVNARDAMSCGGLLKVSARNTTIGEGFSLNGFKLRPGCYVVLEVSDTGEGIPPELLSKIFDAFFTTKTFGKGSGLGLSTVQTVVRGHGGFVDVDSSPGHGTSFMIYLPALRSSVESRERKAITLPAGNGELVLVVDDEAAIRDIALFTLEAYGYRVLLAANGEEGIRMFNQYRDEIRVVLSDVNMPGMNGETMIAHIDELKPNIQVIFMSGVAPQPGQLVRTRMERATNFIQKPFTAEQLLLALSSVIRPMQAEARA